ncbi:antibiotic biosynthesis monooxygenase [Luteimonas sp. SX5]|uniref:Antibiotic biosynthesis monooxygenase n=1 Tax=Luteimonas galliterrae TaxID=2940486 RepID=A0ABT0MKN4_9GAMM|nr:antibiotic biosynthesis monooxygenase [Luteimonas galliterrae]MCL1635442.1 antibiotic biosynthesis monooxygenase [Luteimonas galliterrae]
MFVVIWQYKVREGAEPAFEALYGSDGAWVALFAEYPAHLGTELLRGERPDTYLTIDRWSSEDDYLAFLVDAQPRYQRIDEEGDALTASEHRIGTYRTC